AHAVRLGPLASDDPRGVSGSPAGGSTAESAAGLPSQLEGRTDLAVAQAGPGRSGFGMFVSRREQLEVRAPAAVLEQRPAERAARQVGDDRSALALWSPGHHAQRSSASRFKPSCI